MFPLPSTAVWQFQASIPGDDPEPAQPALPLFRRVLAERQVAGPHATRQLNSLEQRRLVTRVPRSDDQRVRLTTLIPSGGKLVGRYLDVIHSRFDQALSGWSEPGRRDLVRLLGRLVDDLSTHLNKARQRSRARRTIHLRRLFPRQRHHFRPHN